MALQCPAIKGKAFTMWLHTEHVDLRMAQVNLSFISPQALFLYFAGQFLLEEARLIEAAEMAKKAAELDSSEFDVVFNAAHMLRWVFASVP